jgi:hypothetical protein
MSLTVGELVGYMDIEDRPFNKKLEAGGQKWQSFGSVLLRSAVTYAAAAGTALTAAGMAVFNHSAQVEAMGNKAATVFGSQVGMVEEWAKLSANAMGLTKREATGLAANFADLLVPMGFARDRAAELATKVTGLSGPLAQWSNGTLTAAQASDILNKAIMGEREGLRQVGITILESDVQTRLAAEGKDKLTGAALEQAKAEATIAIIFEKSKDAQDAYEKGASKLIKAKMELKAKSRELWDSLSAGLIPVFSQLTGWVMEKVGPALDWLSGTVIPAITSVFSGSAGTIGEKAGALGGVLQAVMEIMGFTRSLWITAWPAIEAIVKPIFDWLTGPSGMGMIQTVLGAISDAQSLLQTAWNLAWPAIQVAIEAAKPVILFALEAIKTALWLIVKPLQLIKDLVDILTGTWLLEAANLTPITASSTPEEVRANYKALVDYGAFEGKQHGGLVTRPGLYPLAEDSAPELVVPLTKPRRAQQLMSQYGGGMETGAIVAALQAVQAEIKEERRQRRADLRDFALRGLVPVG